MNYFTIEYPNHTAIIVKSKGNQFHVLYDLQNHPGLNWHGTFYNPQAFLSLREIKHPDDRQKNIAQELETVLIGK